MNKKNWRNIADEHHKHNENSTKPRNSNRNHRIAERNHGIRKTKKKNHWKIENHQRTEDGAWKIENLWEKQMTPCNPSQIAIVKAPKISDPINNNNNNNIYPSDIVNVYTTHMFLLNPKKKKSKKKEVRSKKGWNANYLLQNSRKWGFFSSSKLWVDRKEALAVKLKWIFHRV